MSRRTKKKKAQRAQFATDPRRAQNANVPDSQLRTQATSRRDELSRRRTLQGVLDPASASIAVRQADAGDDSRALRFYERVERDPHYLSVLETRRRRIAGIPWRLEPASDSPEDIRIAAELEGFAPNSRRVPHWGRPHTKLHRDALRSDDRGRSRMESFADPVGGHAARSLDSTIHQRALLCVSVGPPHRQARAVQRRSLPRAPGAFPLGCAPSTPGRLRKLAGRALAASCCPSTYSRVRGVKDWGVFSELFGMADPAWALPYEREPETTGRALRSRYGSRS